MPVSGEKEPVATVLIPTKNGGELFRDVLAALVEQDAPWPFEILVVDSGSSDNTLGICRSFPGVRLHSIQPHEFGHGRTRNLGMSMSRGRYVALLTQDALPADRHWLRRMVEAVEKEDDVAGAFGRHLAYPDANPFIKRDLKLHFDGFTRHDRIYRLEDKERYARDTGYRQLLHFFSDNNACLRKSVWESIPYPDVEFAEDQIWAKQIIEAGYAKAYVDDASVYHSHNFGVVQTLRRSFDESAAFRRLFGYRLCKTIVHLLAQTARSTVMDSRFLLANRKGISDWLPWLVKCPALNFARQLGFYFGSEWGNRSFVNGLLSLDKAKKAGKG